MIIDIEILNKSYKLKCREENAQAISDCVVRLQSRMNKMAIAMQNKNIDNEQLFLIAAIEMESEINDLQDNYNEGVKINTQELIHDLHFIEQKIKSTLESL